MRSVETEGDTIDQAIANALRALAVARDRVEIEILADSSRGLFGFGGRKARVRATVRAPLFTKGADSSTGDDSRETSPRDDSRETSPSLDPAILASLEARSRGMLEQLLGHLGVTCSVVASTDDGGIVLEVQGDSSGLLIGRRGQTLDALEYLLNRMVARDDGSARVTIDVERYRERRREYLGALALRLAEKAKETGRPVTLNPMSPRDRRIVHLALQRDTGVSTRSEGQGHYRKILIFPGESGKRRGPRGPRPR